MITPSSRPGRINYRALVVLLLVGIVAGTAAVVGHYVRKRAIARRALAEGRAAFQMRDWATASRHLWQYLQKYPDDPDVLAEYAKAQISVQPLDVRAVQSTIAAYRQLLLFRPDDEEAYRQLARLYAGIRDFGNLAYIARKRLDRTPADPQAAIWLGKALTAEQKVEEAHRLLYTMVEQWDLAPGKHPEYIDACAMLSELAARGDAPQSATDSLKWLDRAVQYDSNSADAFLNRARFRRNLASTPGEDRNALMAAARLDLEHADGLKPADPRLRMMLSNEWMRHGEFDRATMELDAIKETTPAVVLQHFLDLNDWRIAKYLQSAELALRKGTLLEGMALTDEALGALQDKAQRLAVLPTAVRVYVAGGRTADARHCLDELTDVQHMVPPAPQEAETAALLEALVSRAELKPYRVIEVLEPPTSLAAANPTALRLLAEAYEQTGQLRRAIQTTERCLRLQPGDLETTKRLMHEYARLQDWTKAMAAARSVETMDPNDLDAKLLRLDNTVNRAAAKLGGDTAARLAAAVTELNQLCQAHPEREDFWLPHSAAMAVQGHMDLVEQDLQQALAHGGSPLHVALGRAHIYANIGRQADALAALRKACAQFPEDAQPWVETADWQKDMAQMDEARATLQAGLEQVSDAQGRRDLRTRLAIVEILRGDRQVGLKLLMDLAAQDKRSIPVRTMLLGLPEIRKDARQAQQIIEEIRQVEGERGLMWRLHQASLWIADGKWRGRQQETQDALQKCIDADPGWSAPAILMGWLQEQLGSFNRAEAVYRGALAADPAAIDVADRLLDLLRRQKRLDQANDVLSRLDASEAALRSRRITVAMQTGNLRQAIDELRIRVSSDAQDAPSRVLLAQLLYQQTKDAAHALMYVDQADAISPGSIAGIVARVGILDSAGRRSEAQEILDNLVEQRASFEAYRLRAGYLASIGQFAEAEKDYRKLSQLPGDGTGYQLLGQFYASANRLDDAISALQEGLARYPDDVALQRNLMRGLLVRAAPADSPEAVRILTALQEKSPQDPELMTLRASLLLSQQTEASTQQAERLLEEAVQLAPTYAEAHLGLITIARQRNDSAAARRLVIRALGTNPSDLRLLAILADTELTLNNFMMARNLANLILKDDPANEVARDILIRAALASRDSKELQAARGYLSDMIARKPHDAILQVTDSLLLTALGRTDQAITNLLAFEQTDQGKNNIEILLALSDLYRVQVNPSKARDLVGRAAALDPENPRVLRAQVVLLGSQQEYGPIVKLMDTYRKSSSPNSDLLLAAASILSGSNTKVYVDAAMSLFEQAVAVNPDSIPALLGLAALSYQVGQVDRAEGIYRKVLEVDASNIQALNDLAWLLCMDRHKCAEALPLVDRAVRLDPDNVHIHDTRGEVLSKLPGRLSQALPEFERCVELTAPDTPERAKKLLQLGRIHAGLQDMDQARRRLGEALKIDERQNVFTQGDRAEIKQIVGAGAQN